MSIHGVNVEVEVGVIKCSCGHRYKTIYASCFDIPCPACDRTPLDDDLIDVYVIDDDQEMEEVIVPEDVTAGPRVSGKIIYLFER